MFDTVYKPTLYALIAGIVLALVSQILGLSVLALIFVVVSFVFLLITMVMTKKQEKILAELPEFTREKKKKKKEELYDLDSVAEEETELEKYKKAKVIVENEVILEKMYMEKGTLLYRIKQRIPFLRKDESQLLPLQTLGLGEDVDSLGLGGDGSPTGGKLSELSMGTPEEPTFFKSSGKYVKEQSEEEVAESQYDDEMMNRFKDSIQAKHAEADKVTPQGEYVIDLDEEDEVWVPGMNMRTGKRESADKKGEKKFSLPTLSGGKKSANSDTSDNSEKKTVPPSKVLDEMETFSDEDLWGNGDIIEDEEVESSDFGGKVGIFNSKKDDMLIPYGEDKTSQPDNGEEVLPDWLVAIQNEGNTESVHEGASNLSEAVTTDHNVSHMFTSVEVEGENGEEKNSSGETVTADFFMKPSDSAEKVEDFTAQETVTRQGEEHVGSGHVPTSSRVRKNVTVEKLFESLQGSNFTPPYAKSFTEKDDHDEQVSLSTNSGSTVREVVVEETSDNVALVEESETENSVVEVPTVKTSTVHNVEKSEKRIMQRSAEGNADEVVIEIVAPAPSARVLRTQSNENTLNVDDTHESGDAPDLVVTETPSVSYSPRLAREVRKENTTKVLRVDEEVVESGETAKVVKSEKVDKVIIIQSGEADNSGEMEKENVVHVEIDKNVTDAGWENENMKTKGEGTVESVSETDETVNAVQGERVHMIESEKVEIVNVKDESGEDQVESENFNSEGVSSEIELSSDTTAQPVLVTQPEVATIANQIASLLGQAEVRAQESLEKKLAEMEKAAEEERKKVERNWEKILEKVRQEALEERKAIEAKAEEEKQQLSEERDRALEEAQQVEQEKIKLAKQNTNLVESLDEAEENLNKVIEAQGKVAEAASLSTRLNAVSKLRKIRQESEKVNAPEEVVQMLDDFINEFRK